MLRRSALTLAILLAACGGGDDDGPSIDAAVAADSSELLADAADQTPCGELGPACDRATQVCLSIDTGGGAPTYECAALPVGCDAVRTCAACAAACEAPTPTCDDSADDNTLLCS